jgi:hypothetical protein
MNTDGMSIQKPTKPKIVRIELAKKFRWVPLLKVTSNAKRQTATPPTVDKASLEIFFIVISLYNYV